VNCSAFIASIGVLTKIADAIRHHLFFMTGNLRLGLLERLNRKAGEGCPIQALVES
jgi:hypothetical protein